MDLSHIRAVIWDFDGVWYDYDAIPNSGFYDLCDYAAASAGCKLVPWLNHQDSLDAARESYKKYHDGISAHIPYLMQTGLSESAAKKIMFREYHSTLFNDFKATCPELLDVCHDTVAALRKLPTHIHQGILTHASAGHWVIPFLKASQNGQFFPLENIVDYEDFDFKPKGFGPEGISLAFNKMGVHPSHTIFVEDSVKNLQVAKQAYPSLTTVLKSNAPDSLQDGVDFVIRNPLDLYQKLSVANELSPKNAPIAPSL